MSLQSPRKYWTLEEDKALLAAVKAVGKNWEVVGRALGRQAGSVEKRHSRLNLAEKARTSQQTQEQVKKAKAAIMTASVPPQSSSRAPTGEKSGGGNVSPPAKASTAPRKAHTARKLSQSGDREAGKRRKPACSPANRTPSPPPASTSSSPLFSSGAASSPAQRKSQAGRTPGDALPSSPSAVKTAHSQSSKEKKDKKRKVELDTPVKQEDSARGGRRKKLEQAFEAVIDGLVMLKETMLEGM
ncbi:hypothetical protein JCM10213_002663 [Rhodosporidiobolus nylandii]